MALSKFFGGKYPRAGRLVGSLLEKDVQHHNNNMKYSKIMNTIRQYCQFRPETTSHFLGAKKKRAAAQQKSTFGLLLDIDGVLCRGKEILPGVRDAFRLLTQDRGTFSVPTVFVTNASNSLRASKAKQLTELVDVPIEANQVVMAHSPLKMFTDLHDKHVLVVGQGPLKEIATMLGFTRVTRLDDLRVIFPHLDCVDFKRRKLQPYTQIQESFPPIEAVLLFGEPLHWESALQFISDILITNGRPGALELKRGSIPYPHLPVLACNLDLVWMAEKPLPLPRFGHGTFLLCLEEIYRKMTAHSLHYTAVMGKPSEITYIHAVHCIQQQARRLSLTSPTTLYAIGDNPESDILGANLFDRYLREPDRCQNRKLDDLDARCFEDDSDADHRSVHNVRRCLSVLVETGVYSAGCRMNGIVAPVHALYEHLDESLHEQLRQPNFVESDFLSAVRTILHREKYHHHNHYYPDYQGQRSTIPDSSVDYNNTLVDKNVEEEDEITKVPVF